MGGQDSTGTDDLEIKSWGLLFPCRPSALSLDHSWTHSDNNTQRLRDMVLVTCLTQSWVNGSCFVKGVPGHESKLHSTGPRVRVQQEGYCLSHSQPDFDPQHPN